MNDIFSVIARNDRTGLAQILARGLDPNAKDDDGRTPLMHAVVGDQIEFVDLLIQSGADVNSQDNDGCSALHFAAQEFRIATAKLLLGHGAHVNACDRHGNTPLWRAVFNSRGRGDIISLLLLYGADRRIKNESGKTPVDLANTIGNYNIKQFLN